MVAVECGVESVAKEFECAYRFKTCHCHKDAEEEENGAHVDARQHVGDTFLHSSVFFGKGKVGVEYLGYCP